MKTKKQSILISFLIISLCFLSGCVLNQENISQKDRDDVGQKYYCEQDSDCSLYAHVCECLNSEYMIGREETLLQIMACTKEEWESTVCMCVNNRCQNKNYKCKWEAGVCEALIMSGYYYDSKENKCKYFPGGSGCSSPPFKSLKECNGICIESS